MQQKDNTKTDTITKKLSKNPFNPSVMKFKHNYFD